MLYLIIAISFFIILFIFERKHGTKRTIISVLFVMIVLIFIFFTMRFGINIFTLPAVGALIAIYKIIINTSKH
jgi:membrane associated rhomboid family serine protease